MVWATATPEPASWRGYLTLRLHRNFAIEPHLLYSQQGAEATVDVIQGTFKLDYLQVPVLLKALFPLSGSPSTRPFLAAGPALGFKVGCKVNVILSVDCDTIGLPIRDTDFSAVAAGGIEVADFMLSIRYGLGVSSSIDASPSISVTNRVLSFLVGYGFRFGPQ